MQCEKILLYMSVYNKANMYQNFLKIILITFFQVTVYNRLKEDCQNKNAMMCHF